MPSLVFEGRRYVQRTHAVECLQCRTRAQSFANRHFVTCRCGAVAVDGGIGPANRVIGRLDCVRDISVWKTEGPRPLTLPQAYLDAHIDALKRRGQN